MNRREQSYDFFTALQSLAELIPEMRIGQILASVGELCVDMHGRGLWDASDEELLETIWQFQRNFEASASLTE